MERFHLLKQRGGFASTELDQEAIGELMERLAQEGRPEEARSLKCWCHTHGTMGAFWSQTDEATCRLLVSDYLISIVVGSGFQIRCRLDAQTPIPLTIDGIVVYYEPSVSKEQSDAYAEELKQHVIPETVSAQTHWQQDADTTPQTPSNGDAGDRDSIFREGDVDVYCEVCGGWHSEEECPFLREEMELQDLWDYGRFYGRTRR